MMSAVHCFLFLLFFSLIPPSAAAQSWKYEKGQDSKIGIILCHGKGGNPESYVVQPLRLGLNRQLGYHTLSLQMPGGTKPLNEYRDDFPTACQQIKAAVSFLHGKGVNTIYLIAHSLGSRMASACLAHSPKPAIDGFVGVGMLNNNGSPFSCLLNLQQISIPVLDIWGEDGAAGDADYARERRVLLSAGYMQKEIADGDHALSEHEDELLEEVATWLLAREEAGKK